MPGPIRWLLIVPLIVSAAIIRACWTGEGPGGMMILLFTPINLRLQAARMMGQPRYDSEIQYGFDENGIEERLGEQVRTYGWDRVQKAVSTPKDIAFYIEESSALVLPKESFGENFMPRLKSW